VQSVIARVAVATAVSLAALSVPATAVAAERAHVPQGTQMWIAEGPFESPAQCNDVRQRYLHKDPSECYYEWGLPSGWIFGRSA
jgi:hypothetical protein